MSLTILRLGIVIFLAGILSYFFTHKLAVVSVMTGLGFTLFVIGFTAWGLEETGDINLS